MLGRIVAFASCATLFSGTAYVVGIALSPPPTFTVGNQERLERYDALSHENLYERKTRGQEFYLGIGRWRRRLLREEGMVRGRVLEVGAGCGGNVAYYDALLHSSSKMKEEELQMKNGIKEVVLSDRAPGMVDSTALQIQKLCGYAPYRYPDYDVDYICEAAEDPQTNPSKSVVRHRKIVHDDGSIVEVAAMPLVDDGNISTSKMAKVAPILHGAAIPGNAMSLLTNAGQAELARREKAVQTGNQGPVFAVANYAAEQLPFDDNSFDTVVDMFGLCSFDDPVRALREISRVCKPDGHILLLEHGKGRWTRINDHLDKWAPRHAKKWGCWWNRDIRRYLRLGGLTIIKSEEKHFGTSQYIVAKPFKTMDEWDAYNNSTETATRETAPMK